jgi:aspartate--ammonia ligase
MDAIRKDEQLDSMHSAYVDQWDWELHIKESDRNIDFLKNVVIGIYDAIKQTAYDILGAFKNTMPDQIQFIHSEELENMYPDLTPKQRENAITKKHGAVFLIGIGYNLSNGKSHDIRAYDYDDWCSPNGDFHGLNGDILVWNEMTQCAFEISSMGIRVDKTALMTQAKIMNKPTDTEYHQMVINEKMPFSIGGGIGQSRLCMFLLGKRHIGEVQVSEWSNEMISECKQSGIELL